MYVHEDYEHERDGKRDKESIREEINGDSKRRGANERRDQR